MKTFFNKLEYRFLVESTKMENALFLYETVIQKPMLRQIEWRVQNGTITKNEVFLATTLSFEKFRFIIRACFKELI